MKKCVHCGKENVDEAIFCADCGAKLGTYNSSTSSSASTTDNSLNYSFNQTSNQANNKEPNKLKVCCCYVPIVLFVLFLAAALIYAGFAESFGTYYPDDFNYLDSNADGKVTFEEITEVNWIYLDNSTLKRFFEGADLNHNGYLKGHEFDLFGDDVVSYGESSEDTSSSNDNYKYSSSSSSSSSTHGRDYSSGSSKYTNSLNNHEYDRSEGYVLTCPYCGSESVYETGGHYRCAECGSNIYNPDDLELGYWEGYMELLAPVSLTIN